MDTLRPLLIAALVLTEVGLWQWRMIIAARGGRSGAVGLGVLGAVLQITAMSQVITNVSDPLSVGAYAAGVGGGVLLGILAGERISPGSVRVTAVSGRTGLADQLWARGWPATVHEGYGADGPVTVHSVTVERRDEARLLRDIADLAPDAHWSVEEQRSRPPAVPVG